LSERSHTPAAGSSANTARPRRAAGTLPLAGLQRAAGNRAVQRLVSGLSEDIDGEAISRRIGAAEGSGSTLDASVRRQLSEALGADPGEIRVHADAEADALSRSLGARAFTSGSDIFFGRGAFDPASPEGFELLLHESTHVLQQAEGPVAGTATPDGALAISDPGDAFEQAASSKAQAQAVAPAAEPSGGRSVQRWPDLDDLAGSIPASMPGPLPGMIDSFGGAISDDASSGNLGMGTLEKAAKAEEAREAQEGKNIRASQKEFDADVDAAAKWTGDGPGARFAGGAVKEAWSIGSGLDSIVQNPLGFQKAQSEKASKEALPMATNQYIDSLGKLSRGEEGLGDAAGEVFGAFTKGKDNEWAAKEQAAKPIVDDVKSGNYAGAFGRVGTQVGVALLSLGEEGPLGEVGAEASAAEEGGAAVKQAGSTEGGLAAGELGPGSTAPKTLPGVAPDPNPLPDLGPVTEPGGPSTIPGVAPDPNPLPGLGPDIGPATVPDPPTLPGLGPDLGPLTVPDPPTLPGLGPDLGPLTTPDPLTLPGLGPDLGPLTVPDPPTLPGLGPDLGPLTVPDPPTLPGLGPDLGPLTTPDPLTLPGLGEPPGPLTRPGVAPDPNPLPDLAPDTQPPGTLESPKSFQGEPVPEQSPLAKSVRDPSVTDPSPSPGGDGPLTQRSPGNEAPIQEQPGVESPLSEGNGPTTADGNQLSDAQEQFEKAWKQYSDEPFGYGLLPGWKP
jgi:hypothetical protein